MLQETKGAWKRVRVSLFMLLTSKRLLVKKIAKLMSRKFLEIRFPYMNLQHTIQLADNNKSSLYHLNAKSNLAVVRILAFLFCTTHVINVFRNLFLSSIYIKKKINTTKEKWILLYLELTCHRFSWDRSSDVKLQFVSRLLGNLFQRGSDYLIKVLSIDLDEYTGHEW